MKRDCYEILGVPAAADEKAIKRAYRKLAKLYHPDTNSGNEEAQKKFREIGEAYSILSDPEKKEIYDQYGWEAFESGMDPKAYRDARREWEQQNRWHGRSASDGDGTTYRTWHFNGNGNPEDLGSIFGDLFGGADPFGSAGRFGGQDPFGSSFRSAGGRHPFEGTAMPRDAGDREASIRIDFEEAVFGCTKTIRLGASDGTAQGFPSGDTASQTLQVDIPAGIEDGKKLRLRGKGARKPGGGNGDLYLHIQVREKPGFSRKGRDIYTEAEIPFVTAVLGGEAKLPTLNGQVLCRIPAGTQSGSKIRLKGKGVPAGSSSSLAGNEYVTIRIQVPRNLTPEETRALRAFEKAAKGKESHTAGGHTARPA